MCSFRRRPHLVSLIVFSCAWGLCVFVLALPFTASAAGVTYHTVRVGPASYAPNGVTTPITVNVAPPGGVARYQQIVPTASNPSLWRLAKKVVRSGGGAGLLVTGAVEGLGYLIDQATGDIVKQESSYPIPSGGSIRPSDRWDYSGCIEDDVPVTGHQYEQRKVGRFVGCASGKSLNVYRWNCDPNSDYPYGDPRTEYNYDTLQRCFYSPFEEVITEVRITETEETALSSQVLNALSLSQKGMIISESVTNASPRGTVQTDDYPIVLTSPNSIIQSLYDDFPELKVALQSLLNAEIAAYLATVDPEFQIAPEDQQIVDQGTTAPPMSPSSELPGFCEWATFICEPFIGGDQPDVPTLDLETPDYDSGLPSGGTCPQPYTFNTGFTGPMEISFQPACDLASAIRTPLIAISYLIAGFIVVGVRR
jgi:hypothetical protein